MTDVIMSLKNGGDDSDPAKAENGKTTQKPKGSGKKTAVKVGSSRMLVATN